MGGGDKTTTQTSGLNNAELNQAVSTIGTQLNSNLATGVKQFGQTLVPGAGDTTKAGWSAALAAGNNPGYSAAINDAITQQGNIATGQVQDDPVRQKALEDALTATGAVFTGSGRFGAGSHAESAAEGATNALAGLDYARQQQAIQNLPGLFSAALMPSANTIQIGGAMDANTQAVRGGEADLFDRLNNSGWNTLGRAGAVLSGTAPAAGTTTTTTQPGTPWWQTAGSLALGGLSLWPK